MSSLKFEVIQDSFEEVDGEKFYRVKALHSFGQDLFTVSIDTVSGLIHETAKLSQQGSCWVDFDSIIDKYVVVSGNSFIERSLIQNNNSDNKMSIFIKGDSIIVDSHIQTKYTTIESSHIEKCSITNIDHLIIPAYKDLIDVMAESSEQLQLIRKSEFEIFYYIEGITRKPTVVFTHIGMPSIKVEEHPGNSTSSVDVVFKQDGIGDSIVTDGEYIYHLKAHTVAPIGAVTNFSPELFMNKIDNLKAFEKLSSQDKTEVLRAVQYLLKTTVAK